MNQIYTNLDVIPAELQIQAYIERTFDLEIDDLTIDRIWNATRDFINGMIIYCEDSANKDQLETIIL